MNVALRQACRSTRTRHVRALATAVQQPTASSSRKPSTIPISNIEAQWAILDKEEQQVVREQLSELQKKDWKDLSIDEKKAAYWVSFGPHGMRKPVSQPGDNFKVFLGTTGLVAASVVAFFVIRSFAGEPPVSMTREWQEASNEIGKKNKLNPISGLSSEGYKGQGFISVDK